MIRGRVKEGLGRLGEALEGSWLEDHVALVFGLGGSGHAGMQRQLVVDKGMKLLRCVRRRS